MGPSTSPIRAGFLLCLTCAGLLAGCSGDGAPQEQAKVDFVANAARWVDEEFQPSTLNRAEQMSEMAWFTAAAEPLRGMSINVVSETLTTHQYEAEKLTAAFEEITGIKVTHDLIQEGDVIEKLQTQMQTGQNVYDAYVNDSDLIGTHSRYGYVVPLSDFIAGEGQAFTSPTLDLDDFIGLAFTTGPDGQVYQLPDQQFANLYWFRYDWFQRPELKEAFLARYGYPLGVPVNWSAYEDIAEFFTEHVGTIDGERVYGHMDYGKKDPSLGWRFTDAWLSMAGAGDKGIPNGLPVDEWGMRVEGCRPAGSAVVRGGAVNGPAAVYALTRYMDWLKKYAPPEAQGMTFSEAGSVPAQGHIAQQIFWYTTFTADMIQPGLAVVNPDGTPKWRMAPSPHGPYWEEGMKLGYQDTGSWTLLKSTPLDRRQAAWLYAQFVTAKTLSLKKTLVGLTPFRNSDLHAQAMSDAAPRLGGLVEFYRSPDRVRWTPTGTNIPDYPKLAALWWPSIADAVSGSVSAQVAMDRLAERTDAVLARLENIGIQGDCGPRLNEPEAADVWLARPGAPKPQLADEKPAGQTVPYDELINAWREAGSSPGEQ
ncbi:MAG: ABC transporter substrate-binding protein [Proteobacteria bacterium]|nr:ABC transporter substrate-binding protein [Pseudomonadota bacterium]